MDQANHYIIVTCHHCGRRTERTVPGLLRADEFTCPGCGEVDTLDSLKLAPVGEGDHRQL